MASCSCSRSPWRSLRRSASGPLRRSRGGQGGVETLRESGGGRAAARLRGGSLVTVEIALGLVLTVLAGLTMRTFAALRSVDLGFNAEHVVIARVGVSGPRYADGRSRDRSSSINCSTRVRALPGVQSASAISTRPFGGMAPATTLGDANAPAAGDSVHGGCSVRRWGVVPDAAYATASPAATFDRRDAIDAPPRVDRESDAGANAVAVGDAIGKRLRVPMFNGIMPEVIGVVGDVHLMDARTPPRGTIYLASSHFPSDALDLIVRGRNAT